MVSRVKDDTSVAELERSAYRELIFSPGAERLMAIGGTSFSTFFVGGLFVEEHIVVWDLASGRQELRLPDSRIDSGDYQTNIGPRADERRQLSSVVWNVHTREVAGTVYPSMLAYWTVPSTMVPGRLTAWRLTDDGLVEIYRGSDRERLSAKAFATGGGAVIVAGDDDYRRTIDLSGSRPLAKSCDTVQREWADVERRQHLGSGWRRPLRCQRHQ